jgi:hypothetical protein
MTEALNQALRSALAFAASHSCITSAQKQAILAAFRPATPSATAMQPGERLWVEEAAIVTPAALEAVEAHARLRTREGEVERVAMLWALLDDIDTLDDACRADDAAFRDLVRVVQRKRFLVMPGEEFEPLHDRARAAIAAMKGEG